MRLPIHWWRIGKSFLLLLKIKKYFLISFTLGGWLGPGLQEETGGREGKGKGEKSRPGQVRKTTKVKKATLFSGLRIWIRIFFGSWIRIRIRVKSWKRISIVVEIQKLQRLKMEPWRGCGLSLWRSGGSKMEPGRVCRPVDADSHHAFTLMK